MARGFFIKRIIRKEEYKHTTVKGDFYEKDYLNRVYKKGMPSEYFITVFFKFNPTTAKISNVKKILHADPMNPNDGLIITTPLVHVNFKKKK